MQKKAKRRPKPGTIRQLQGVLWAGILRLEDAHGEDELSNDELRRLMHALSQASGPYLRAVEVGELEARVEALALEGRT